MKRANTTRTALGLAALLARRLLARGLRRRRNGPALEKSTVVVCGASRGLGRAIALELARRGVKKIGICARDKGRLAELAVALSSSGAMVVAEQCDLRSDSDVERFLSEVRTKLGPVDILITNAAQMSVQPASTLMKEDFDDAMSAIFYTTLHPLLAVIPQMRNRKRGTIAIISSIGGKVGVPHLGPYCAAKFATMGLAESLRSELALDGIHVLAVTPGLMRTGSHVHAEVKGDYDREYAWFSAAATAPLLSIDADRAARRIVRSIIRGDNELAFTPEAKISPIVRNLMPNLWSTLMRMTAFFLPRAHSMFPRALEPKEGIMIERSSSSNAVRTIAEHGRPYARRHAQIT